MKPLMRQMASALLLVLAAGASAADSRTQEVFEQWRKPHEPALQHFQTYLKAHGVDAVVPLHELLRTASDWNTAKCRRAGATPFEIPPEPLWPATAKTLKLIERLRSAQLLPPFEIVSAYRNKNVERCAEGAGSRHPKAGAVDVVPVDAKQMGPMVKRLCDYWFKHGEQQHMGLSVYPSKRVHIDTVEHGTWGKDKTKATSECRRRSH